MNVWDWVAGVILFAACALAVVWGWFAPALILLAIGALVEWRLGESRR